MHIVVGLSVGALATLIGIVWIIGWSIGHNVAKRQAEKTRIRLAARAERRAKIGKTMQRLLPWRRVKESDRVERV